MVKVKITKEIGDKARFNREHCEVIDIIGNMIMLMSSSNKMYCVYEGELEAK